MDAFDEIEELEFEEVTCNCNLRNNNRYVRAWCIGYTLIILIGCCFFTIYPMVSGVFVCMGTIVSIVGAIYYVFYSKKNHGITLVLEKDTLTYIDKMGTSKVYTLHQLMEIRKTHVFGWGMCYEFCFHDQSVKVYDGDDLSGLLMGLRTLGKFGLERK